MGLEAATYIDELVATNPIGGSDNVSQGDDHIRLLKSVLQSTFPNISGAVTLTDTQLNDVARKAASNSFSAKQIIDSAGTDPPLDLKSTAGAYVNYYKGAAAFAAAGSGEALGGAAGSWGVYVNGALRVTIATDGSLATPGTTAAEVGRAGLPQTVVSNDNYTLVLGDRNGHIYYTGSGHTITIPANASVAFPIGTTITFINRGAASISIAITSDTLELAVSGAGGTRTLVSPGVATAIKVTSTLWEISGTGLS